MTNPQLTKNLLEVIRSLPDQDRRWLLEQLGQATADLYSFMDGEPIVAT